MFTYITWGLVMIILVILAKRIGRGIFGVMLLVGVTFFSIFMVDTFTTVDLRKFIPLGFYDKTVEDPMGAASEVNKELQEAGNKAVDKVNEIGENADVYFEINRSGADGDKTWYKGDPVEGGSPSGTDVKEEVAVESKEGDKKASSDGIAALTKGKGVFLTYEEVDMALRTEYAGLKEVDKEIIRAFSPVLKTKIEGTDIVVYNDTDRVKEGFFIELK